jgi:hypothetical protein
MKSFTTIQTNESSTLLDNDSPSSSPSQSPTSTDDTQKFDFKQVTDLKVKLGKFNQILIKKNSILKNEQLSLHLNNNILLY